MRRSVALDASVSKHDLPLRERGDARLVRHHHDREAALFGQAREQLLDLIAARRVEVDGRLVRSLRAMRR